MTDISCLINLFDAGAKSVETDTEAQYIAFTQWLCDERWMRFAYHFETGESFIRDDFRTVDVYGL